MAWAALAAATLFCTPAFAQAAPRAPNPVMDNFRAYQAAFQAGDYEGAEAPAAAAFAAARSANHARTGVLAFNLALLRALKLHKLSDALAAATVASQTVWEGVDPGQARALFLLARLDSDYSEASRELEAVLSAVAAGDEGAAFYNDVAMAWARYAMDEKMHQAATRAYGHAIRYLSVGGAPRERALVLVARGAAQTMAEDSTGGIASITEAVDLLVPFAPESVGATAPPDEMLLGQALAWRSVATAIQYRDSRAYSRGGTEDAPGGGTPARALLPGRPIICMGAVQIGEMPAYPRTALYASGVAGVTVRFGVNENGDVLHPEVIGSVPDRWFAESVRRSAQQWRYIWSEGQSDCRRESDDMLTTVRFMVAE